MNRTIRRGTGVGIAATFLVATAAAAHPQFNPRDLPPEQAVQTELVVPHGCGDSQEVATTSVEVAWDDHVSPLPRETDGWEPFVEPGEAWGWTDAGGATADVIVLPLAVSVDGEVGDELDLVVRQACDETGDVILWGGGDADFPAARINLAEELGQGSDTAASAGDHDDADHGDADDADDHGADDDSDGADDHGDEADDADDHGDHGDDAAESGGGYDIVTVIVMAVVTLGGIGAIVGMARKNA